MWHKHTGSLEGPEEVHVQHRAASYCLVHTALGRKPKMHTPTLPVCVAHGSTGCPPPCARWTQPFNSLSAPMQGLQV